MGEIERVTVFDHAVLISVETILRRVVLKRIYKLQSRSEYSFAKIVNHLKSDRGELSRAPAFKLVQFITRYRFIVTVT